MNSDYFSTIHIKSERIRFIVYKSGSSTFIAHEVGSPTFSAQSLVTEVGLITIMKFELWFFLEKLQLNQFTIVIWILKMNPYIMVPIRSPTKIFWKYVIFFSCYSFLLSLPLLTQIILLQGKRIWGFPPVQPIGDQQRSTWCIEKALCSKLQNTKINQNKKQVRKS